jgi:hypothetical protein
MKSRQLMCFRGKKNYGKPDLDCTINVRSLTAESISSGIFSLIINYIFLF